MLFNSIFCTIGKMRLSHIPYSTDFQRTPLSTVRHDTLGVTPYTSIPSSVNSSDIKKISHMQAYMDTDMSKQFCLCRSDIGEYF